MAAGELMASQTQPYVRVYYRIIDDPRFEFVYDDDAALALWLRLLLIADAAWPASATLPVTARVRPLRRLTDAGLVTVTKTHRFQIHGMEAERRRRIEESRSGGRVRAETGPRDARGRYTTGGPHGWTPQVDATGGDHRVQPSEPSLAETSRAEPVRAREADALDDYYTLTGRYPAGRTAEWLTELANEFGHDMTGRALAAEWAVSREAKTILSRTADRLRAEAHQADRERAKPRPRKRETPEERERVDAERRALVAEWTSQVKDVPKGPFVYRPPEEVLA